MASHPFKGNVFHPSSPRAVVVSSNTTWLLATCPAAAGRAVSRGRKRPTLQSNALTSLHPMAGARRAPRDLGPPKLPVLPQAGGDRRRPAGLRCLHCRRGLRGPGRAHPPPASRGTAAARRARAGGGAGTPAAALPRGAAALATGRAPATSRRWRRGWGSRPSPSAGSGRWHLQPRRSAPRSLSSLLHGSSLLPRPRRTVSRIPGRRQRRGASGSHGGARRGREGPATSHAPECIKETCRAASPTLRRRARLCRSPLSVSLCLSPSAAEQSETRRLWCDVRCSLLICVPCCRLQFFWCQIGRAHV